MAKASYPVTATGEAHTQSVMWVTVRRSHDRVEVRVTGQNLKGHLLENEGGREGERGVRCQL